MMTSKIFEAISSFQSCLILERARFQVRVLTDAVSQVLLMSISDYVRISRTNKLSTLVDAVLARVDQLLHKLSCIFILLRSCLHLI